MVDRSYYVYAHYHPYCSAPFYIGKGKGWRAKVATNRPIEWQSEAAKGLEVVIVKDGLPEACAFTMEKILIATSWAEMLVNKTKGGGGPSGMKQTPESNAKRSAALKGEKNHNYGRKLPEHIRQALIKRHTGSKHSEEHKRKRSEKQSGKKHSQFDWNRYEFYHPDHGVIQCLRSEFIEKYGLLPSKVSNLINGRRRIHKGWAMHGHSIPLSHKPSRQYSRKV